MWIKRDYRSEEAVNKVKLPLERWSDVQMSTSTTKKKRKKEKAEGFFPVSLFCFSLHSRQFEQTLQRNNVTAVTCVYLTLR